MIDPILRTGRGEQASVVGWIKAAFIPLITMWSVCRYALRILINLIMCSAFTPGHLRILVICIVMRSYFCMDYKKQAGAGDTVKENKHGRLRVVWGDPAKPQFTLSGHFLRYTSSSKHQIFGFPHVKDTLGSRSSSLKLEEEIDCLHQAHVNAGVSSHKAGRTRAGF